MKNSAKSGPGTLGDWSLLADKKARHILKKARSVPTLSKKGGGPARWEMSIRMVGAARMKELNRRFRGKDYPTDVLSFPAPEVFRAAGILGELVICVPVLKKQAAELGHAPQDELLVLLVHGVLHLLGYDHEIGPKEAREMRKWEARLLGPRAAMRGLIERTC